MTAYDEAKAAYLSSENNKWTFAEKASYVEEIQTRQLADELKISISTVQNSRNAYHLYYQLCNHFETSEMYTMKDHLYVSIFTTMSRYVKKLTLEKIREYLLFAKDDSLTVVQFKVLLDNDLNPVPKWIRDLVRGAKAFSKYDKEDYKSDIPPHAQRIIKRAIMVFNKIIRTIPELKGLEE